MEKFNVDASCVCRNILGDQMSCCVSRATKQSCKKGKAINYEGSNLLLKSAKNFVNIFSWSSSHFCNSDARWRTEGGRTDKYLSDHTEVFLQSTCKFFFRAFIFFHLFRSLLLLSRSPYCLSTILEYIFGKCFAKKFFAP